MIQEITIKNFKCIDDEILEIKPITILTGTNSSGKSTILQSILLLSYHFKANFLLDEIATRLNDFRYIKNSNIAEKESSIQIKLDNKNFTIFNKTDESWQFIKKPDDTNLFFEERLYYVGANRIGAEAISQYSKNKFGINGEYVFGYYDKNKDEVIKLEIQDESNKTLNGQLHYWGKEILDLDLNIQTQQIDNTNLSIKFGAKTLSNLISAHDVGTGVSYVLKIIIMALSLKKGDIFLIENPEIHLHPKAISKLTHFFTYLVDNDIQLIIETHSEHIINSIRYCAYKNKLKNNDIIMHYKANSKSKFNKIFIDKNGKFIDENNNKVKFPEGFFDANLKELLELL